MLARTFVDANVLVYAYDTDAGRKHERAQSILVDLWESESGVVSTQVLQEFYVTVTRKLPKPLPKRTAREIVATYESWSVHRPGIADVVAASELEERHRLAFWDALIVVSAQHSGTERLLSEDLQDGRRIAGVRIANPFAA
jgi:predicted nucleic acid-binding protein